jgi:aryl-alcohol dehydrogenase-like predicted oxidoreductase
MIARTYWSGEEMPALGLGCWAIGGPFYAGETPLGWGEVDDAVSIRAIHAGVDAGIRFFDTAQAYGAGHSEEVLGRALDGRNGVMIGTKCGHSMDRATRRLTGNVTDAGGIKSSLEDSLRRLRRNQVDIVHLHLNDLPLGEAGDVFAVLEDLRTAGKVGAYGWSTDFADRAESYSNLLGFKSVQFEMNVFRPAREVLAAAETVNRTAVIRGPLAMGLLSGKYDGGKSVGADDIRAQNMPWLAYFKDGRVAPEFEQRLASVRELLQSGGRSMVQGALGWLWAASERTLPIPGFRTDAQVEDLAGALRHGPLPPAIFEEINRLMAT